MRVRFSGVVGPAQGKVGPAGLVAWWAGLEKAHVAVLGRSLPLLQLHLPFDFFNQK